MSSENHLLEVALFPIPELVAFPGTVVPLHVFEPRYRRLVHDCVDADRLVGVCHIKKIIHEPKRQQSLEETLRSNQATYQPREVFSAGSCSIRETMDDGRILAEVAMSQRLLLTEELQSLPYRIVSCEPLPDEPEEIGEQAAQLRSLINDRLIALLGEHPDIADRLRSPAWVALEPAEFSFRIFQFVRLEADMMQSILESRNVATRLEMLWDQLRRA